MRPARSYGSKKPSAKSQQAAAAMFIHGCTDEAFARLQPESVARSYGVTVEWAENHIRDRKRRAA